jgi:hypothetical protein
VLWLLGVEVLPAIHEGTHASSAPHRHDGGGMVVTVSFGEPTHRHTDGSVHAHSPAAPAKAKRPRTEGLTRMSGELPHGADGIAHHASALQQAAPPIAEPLPIDLRPMLVAIRATAEPVSLDPLAPNARGPPTLA